MVSIVAFKKVSLFGLIHKFNDSGHLLKSSTYSDNKVLSSRELLGPPTIKIVDKEGNPVFDEGVLVKNYYHDGLPPYGNFLKSWSSKEIKKLRVLFNDSKPENDLCVFQGRKRGLQPNGNVCDKSLHKKFSNFFVTKIPWFENGQLAYIKKNINTIPTLFVMVSTGDEYDNYTVIYQISFLDEDKGAFYMYGPYLEGNISAIKTINDKDALFIKYQSCTECHPWVYMAMILFDLAKKNSGIPVHFKYSSYDPAPRLEYALPGLGHSVNGTAETRVSKVGPFSIIQKFNIYKGDIEWWGFKCSNILCSSKLVKGGMPLEFADGWKTGYILQ